ncbi:MAG: AAA family ATPase [Myxococcales bacterium]|nr:AAA family ATPase [Myxococcales bacterium]
MTLRRRTRSIDAEPLCCAPPRSMIAAHDPDHMQTAFRRFREFFDELRATFVERENLLVQFALALLSRQHVLMTGPPGTAKSQMASLVLGRIIDESTGGPSLFARQFTENTVQTDLVGPIDFKTLMESGRTEHFTDEGMLGSVHAFLDEVFDGRDMLLRSTLNLLHERELKQGGVVAKGRIECAFMTSNRYIAEVLDTARETLLAFIDRISFISFVPRGFADPKSLRTVVRRHGGGFGQHAPTAYLSVQDLDVLQAAADITYVPEEICDAVAQLVTMLDEELAEARRYDPKFQPTRYLSTRTTVQATYVLRAVVIYDKIFGRKDRALQVEHADLEWLRLFLLMGGVERASIAARLERETDPRERRQLDIMATEAEIFDRCYGKLPRVDAPLRPRRLELSQLEAVAKQARRSGEPNALEHAVRTLLTATESGATDATKAAHLLVDTVGTLFGQALRGGLTPGLHEPDGLAALSRHLTEVADTLERTPGRGLPLAHWLRGRLLHLLDDALRLSVSPTAATVGTLASNPSVEAVTKRIDERLGELEALFGLRRLLRSGYAMGAGSVDSDGAWDVALTKLEDELTLLWDARFRLTAMALLTRASKMPLDEVLRALSPMLTQLHTDATRFARLGREGELVARVTGPRIEPLVARAFERLDGRKRGAIIDQVEAVVAELRSAALGEVISPERFVAWTAPAFVRDDVAPAAAAIVDRTSYDAARGAEPELSITDTLIRIAIAALPPERHTPQEPDQAAEAVWQTLRAMERSHRDRVVALDLARAERAIVRLESWWQALQQPAEGAEGDAPWAVAVLERVVHSGYLRAVRGDAEPLRLAAELDHLGEVFPACSERTAALRQRLVELDASSTRVLVELLQGESNRAWAEALAPRAKS